MDEPLARLAIAAGTLVLGWVCGRTLRLRGPRQSATLMTALPTGVYLLTAPFCVRCTSLRERLTEMLIPFRELDVREVGDLVAALSIRAAPTLMAVSSTGRVTAAESASFTEERIATIASAASGPA